MGTTSCKQMHEGYISGTGLGHLDLSTTVPSTTGSHPRRAQHAPPRQESSHNLFQGHLQPHHADPTQHIPLWITDSLLCRCSRARTIWGQSERVPVSHTPSISTCCRPQRPPTGSGDGQNQVRIQEALTDTAIFPKMSSGMVFFFSSTFL